MVGADVVTGQEPRGAGPDPLWTPLDTTEWR